MTSNTLVPTTTRDLRRAGLGALIAAITLVLTPLYVFLSPLFGAEFPTGAEKFDPVTNASWVSGLAFGTLETVQAAGIAVLVVGVRRALPDGWGRDLGALAGVLWIAGLALHAGSMMVLNTPAQIASWESVSADVSVRAAIGAGATVVQWGFWATGIVAGLGWMAILAAAGLRPGIVGRAAAIAGVVIAAIAGVLALLGIIPPAATLAQIVLYLVIAIALLRRSARFRTAER